MMDRWTDDWLIEPKSIYHHHPRREHHHNYAQAHAEGVLVRVALEARAFGEGKVALKSSGGRGVEAATRRTPEQDLAAYRKATAAVLDQNLRMLQESKLLVGTACLPLVRLQLGKSSSRTSTYTTCACALRRVASCRVCSRGIVSAHCHSYARLVLCVVAIRLPDGGGQPQCQASAFVELKKLVHKSAQQASRPATGKRPGW